jgi:hypothetical protein
MEDSGMVSKSHEAHLITGVEEVQQDWSLDKTGNWQGFTEAATGGSNTLVQSRAANPVNEITDITNTTGDAWTQPRAIECRIAGSIIAWRSFRESGLA